MRSAQRAARSMRSRCPVPGSMWNVAPGIRAPGIGSLPPASTRVGAVIRRSQDRRSRPRRRGAVLRRTRARVPICCPQPP